MATLDFLMIPLFSVVDDHSQKSPIPAAKANATSKVFIEVDFATSNES